MKYRVLVFLGIAAVIISGAIFCWTMFFTGVGNTYYYTQIDNGRFTEVGQSGLIDLSGNGGMEYSYTLPSYDENGGGRDITFGVSRELRESAFLRLTFREGRGVMDWCEVTYDELPQAVQKHYTAPPQSQAAGAFRVRSRPVCAVLLRTALFQHGVGAVTIV